MHNLNKDLDDPVEPSEEENSVQTLNGVQTSSTPKLTQKTPVKRASSVGTSLSSTPNVKAISLSSIHSSTPKRSPNIRSQLDEVTKTSVKEAEAAGSAARGGGTEEASHQPGLCKCGQKCVIL